MEEVALIANIATILQKDLLCDEKNNLRTAKHFLNGYNDAEAGGSSEDLKFPLLEANDDDDIVFYALRKRMKTREGAKDEKDTFPAITDSKSKFTNLFRQMPKKEFEKNLHMTQSSLLNLFRSISYILKQEDAEMENIDIAFSLAIWKLTTDDHFEQISRKFQRPLKFCQDLTRMLWHQITQSSSQFIQWPNLSDSLLTMQRFRTHPQLKFLPKLFSVIAIKPVNVFLESLDKEVAVIWQVVFNADQSIIDCHVELASNYDFNKTPLAQKLNPQPNMHLPSGCYLIGNQNFPLKSYLIKGFKDPPTEKEQSFNKLLEPAHRLAFLAFDKICRRFNILYSLEARDFSEVRNILTTICAFHNLCVELGDNLIEKSFATTDLNWSQIPESSLDAGIYENLVDTNAGINRRLELIKEIWNKH